MIVLGIETTCDETAAAVVERFRDGRGNILSNVVLSQVNEHAAFGGVVPEIAARAHVETLDRIIGKAMAEAGTTFRDIDGVAAAAGPGLIGGPSGSPVMLIVPPQACAIMSKARLCSNGLPSPKPLTCA